MVVKQSKARPASFLTDVLGASPYRKQVEIMEAVRDHRRVSVVGANSSGKDWAVGRLILWWLTVFHPAKVIVTGPTSRQVSDIVWKECRQAYHDSLQPLGGRMYDKDTRFELSDNHFALGFATDKPYNLQGFHSPNLLVVITEAHAVSQSHFQALRRLNSSRTLLTGNAFSTAGELYDSFHVKRSLYHTISISAFDTPNVSQGRVVIPGMVTVEDIEDRKLEWGEESPLYVASVLGRFPDNLEDRIIPLSAITLAVQRHTELDPQTPVILGVDVAREGEDKTVVVRRQGDVARIVWRIQGANTMRTAGWVAEYCSTNHVDTVVVDDTGVGGGVTDRLKETLPNTHIAAFKGGAKAGKPDRFANAVAEAWWAVRDWLTKEGSQADIEDDGALIGQLSARGYEIQSDRVIRLEAKEKMGKSPDEADALALTFGRGKGRPNVRFV